MSSLDGELSLAIHLNENCSGCCFKNETVYIIKVINVLLTDMVFCELMTVTFNIWPPVSPAAIPICFCLATGCLYLCGNWAPVPPKGNSPRYPNRLHSWLDNSYAAYCCEYKSYILSSVLPLFRFRKELDIPNVIGRCNRSVTFKVVQMLSKGPPSGLPPPLTQCCEA